MKNFLIFKRNSRLCCLLIIQLLCMPAFALSTVATTIQQQPITGTISDAEGALPGVSITIKDTTQGTLSDQNGHYSIIAQHGDVLVFSFIGYKTVEMPVSDSTVIDVLLEQDATLIDEVIINAGYYSVKDRERTGSIARITAKDIEGQPVTNVLAAMQGRMPGVNITQTTGVPGGGFEIEIRGRNSLRTNGNNPLYIIDGVPYSADPIGTGMTSPIIPTQPSPLNSINPEQIESIEVLKDADATAIYGSRGANGVVLITTKKGKQGQMQFTTSLSQAVGTATGFIKMLNTEQYLSMRNEAFANDGFSVIPEYAYDINGTWDSNRYTDWQKELLGKSAIITNVQTTLTGGNTQTRYLLSGNYNKQNTTYPGDFGYKKANFLLNVNHTSVSNKFKTNFSVGYTGQDNHQPSSDLTAEVFNLAPNAPALYDESGGLNWENSTFNNPLRNLEGTYKAMTYDLIANGQLSYELSDQFTIKTSFGMTSINHNDSNTSPSTQYDPAYGADSSYSAIFVSNAQRKSWIFEPQLDWKKNFGKSEWSVLGGATFQSQTGSQLVQYGMGFPSNSLIYNLGAAATIMILNDQETNYKYQAFYGRVNYKYNSRYILNLTGRRDGSSRFGPGNQFANFGAIGGAWLFSEEEFLSNSQLLSFGKLRTSYGITGSDQIGDYQYLDTYATTGQNYQGVIGMQPTRLFNPQFAWETNKKLEIALEMGLLNDRVFLTTGWYSNRSSNQLIGVPLPGTTGFSYIQANLDATIENTGTEISLRTINLSRKDFSWISSFNISFAKNKLLSFPDLEGSTYRNQFVIGESIGIKHLYQLEGVNPETGVYEFADLNGDGAITASGDKKVLRDFSPEYFGGFHNEFRYKNWKLDFLLQFVKQLNWNQYAVVGAPGTFGNQPVDVLDRWQQPGDISTHQLFTDGSNSEAFDAYYRFLESTGAVSDASFIRLKNISLSWTIPSRYTKFFECRLNLQAQNLLTFTNYKGADPEFKSAGYLPPLRVISAGLHFTF